MRRAILAVFALEFSTIAASGQEPALSTLSKAAQFPLTDNILQSLAGLTLLSLAPSLLVTMTSFTRFIVSFSLLRSGLGLQGAPANLVLIILSLFMTFFVMSPVFDKAWSDGLSPMLTGQVEQGEGVRRAIAPFRQFMIAQVRDKDIGLFRQLSRKSIDPSPESLDDLHVIAPAFLISELRRGFEIGFLIMLPFLVIDMIIATLTMSMGMMMLPPSVISLPIKILFFVLIDGWNILVGQLIKSFQ